jgi:uncharacterized protein (DUF2252 family)
LRFSVLLGGGPKRHQRLCLLDIKEAIIAAAPGSKEADKKQDFAVRVVKGACVLSLYFGGSG